MGIGSITSTAAINRYGTRLCLVMGGIGCAIWIFSTILAVYSEELDEAGVPEAFIYTGLFMAAVINGFTVGILFTASNQYVADCSSEQNKGFFFSYFWCFF